MIWFIAFVYWFMAFLYTFIESSIKTRRVDGYLTIGKLVEHFFLSLFIGWLVPPFFFAFYLMDLKVWNKKVFKK